MARIRILLPLLLLLVPPVAAEEGGTVAEPPKEPPRAKQALNRVFRGRILKIKKNQVSIYYDFEDPDQLKDFEDAPERWIDLRWDVEERTPQRFPARIALQTVNEPGSLAQVAQVIAEHDGNIDNISMERSSPDFTSVTIDLEVFDIKHLNSIIAQLRAKDVVANAERVNA